MLRFEGEMLGVLVASGMRVVVAWGLTAFLMLAGGFEDGGWFSASEDWGDADGVRCLGGDVCDGGGLASFAGAGLGVGIAGVDPVILYRSSVDVGCAVRFDTGAAFGGRPLDFVGCGFGSLGIESSTSGP